MKRLLVLAFAALIGGLLLPGQAAHATPVQGYLSWSILLCKFADHPEEPEPPSYFEELFLPEGKGQKGVFDFLDQQSRGRATTAGSVVKGWYTMPYTLQQSKDVNRPGKIDQCVQTAKAAGYTPPADHRIAVMLNVGYVDSGAWGTSFLLDQTAWKAGLAAHEFMHGHGVGHSFSNDPNWRIADWAEAGEYDDPWDLMSAQNHYGPWTGKFSWGVVGFNGPHLDEVGWLPYPRVVTAGQDGRTSMTVQLAPLERQDLPGALLLRVPFDPADLNHYYTVEFRKKDGRERGHPPGHRPHPRGQQRPVHPAARPRHPLARAVGERQRRHHRDQRGERRGGHRDGDHRHARQVRGRVRLPRRRTGRPGVRHPRHPRPGRGRQRGRGQLGGRVRQVHPEPDLP
ncbi:hypothetical protein ACWEPN_41980 [Nonomuraea wenchangensis]